MRFATLYGVTNQQLINEIANLIDKGYEVTCVTNLRPLDAPNMDGVIISDWLIIYKDKESESE